MTALGARVGRSRALQGETGDAGRTPVVSPAVRGALRDLVVVAARVGLALAAICGVVLFIASMN